MFTHLTIEMLVGVQALPLIGSFLAEVWLHTVQKQRQLTAGSVDLHSGTQ